MKMFKKIKLLIQENREFHNKELLQLNELEWAHIYHDSIRGKTWLENLPLNIGRWAGNYSFFYVLNRVLNDFQPKHILEFGLGESSKFVTAFLENKLINSSHLIIEHDENWYKSFKNNFDLSERTTVEICPLSKRNVLNYEVNTYLGLKNVVKQKFDLYIIDGPFGSFHYSRYDIVELAKEFKINDEFIIIIDDYQRKGEKETVQKLFELFKKKSIPIYSGEYSGNKSVKVLATRKFKSVNSL